MSHKTPDYMIPLDYPLDNYIYAPEPDMAHWTSSPVWAQAVYWRNNPRKLVKVPKTIKKTPRSAATRISAIGKKGHWPIGDLYHARLAMIYIMSPSHAKVRNKVIAAVKEHYPLYDWDGWLEEHEAKLARQHRRAAANPRYVRSNPTKAVLTERLRELYRQLAVAAAQDDLAALNVLKKEIDQIEEELEGPALATMPEWEVPPQGHEDLIEMFKMRSNPHEDGLPNNAGPYLPDMFPYGVGGRLAPLPPTDVQMVEVIPNPRRKYIRSNPRHK